MPEVINIITKLCFLNTGVITPKNAYRRRWEANRDHGFVSAGQNKKSGEAIRSLTKDAIICAYISEYGFVGIGEVMQEALPIEEFCQTYPVRGRKHITKELFDNAGNDEFQEYVVQIRWTHWPRNETTKSIIGKTETEIIACSVAGRGYHIHPGVCCELRKDKPRQIELIDFIEKGFDVEFLFKG